MNTINYLIRKNGRSETLVVHMDKFKAHEYAAEPHRRRQSKMAAAELVTRRAKCLAARTLQATTAALQQLALASGAIYAASMWKPGDTPEIRSIWVHRNSTK